MLLSCDDLSMGVRKFVNFVFVSRSNSTTSKFKIAMTGFLGPFEPEEMKAAGEVTGNDRVVVREGAATGGRIASERGYHETSGEIPHL